MSLISIVIRCYNEEEHIGRLLSGIIQQTTNEVEIIIVDSGSTDATLAIASRYPVKIISIKPEEFSFGRSLNRGCEVAIGEFIVIASAHVYPVYRDWLEKLISPFAQDDIALTYGKQRGNNVTQFSEHQIFAQWFPDESHSTTQDHPFCNNANAAIRRSLWKKFPYNEDLTGLEDVDWAKKMVELGYKIVYVPEAEIIHVHQETPKRIFNRYRREAIALKQIYPQETFSFWDFIRLSLGNTFSDYYHALEDHTLSQHLLAIPVFRFMQFWGTYRGYQKQKDSTNIKLRETFYYPRNRSHVPHSNTIINQHLAINYSEQELSETQVVENIKH